MNPPSETRGFKSSHRALFEYSSQTLTLIEGDQLHCQGAQVSIENHPSHFYKPGVREKERIYNLKSKTLTSKYTATYQAAFSVPILAQAWIQ